ncbi:MAG: PEGA domain-containing protein [Deltaproteobacteria bacterium]|nr:PEGA domain-containing protein [Deltaproteobacteria bacterium]
MSLRFSWILPSIAGLLASLSSNNVAQSAPQGDAPSKAARVTAFYRASDAFPAKTLVRISRHINKALRRDRRLAVKDSDKLLAEFAGDIPADELSQSKQTDKEGVRLLQEGSFKLAAAKLAEAISQYEEILAFVKKRRLATCMLALGVAQARAGARKKSLATFTRLLIWRPRIRFPVALYGAKIFTLFQRASRRVKHLRRGSVDLKTTPDGAKAYLDGRFAGVTPTTAFGLTSGEHYATYKKSGFVKGAQKIRVSGRKQYGYVKELQRSEKFLLLKQTLRKAEENLGAPKANSAMVDLRAVLFVDQVLFVTAKAIGEDKIEVATYLYDLRSKLRLNQSKMTLPRNDLTRVKELARLTYLNVRLDGDLEAPPDAPPPPPKKRRAFYATWWFWTAVGVVGAGVAGVAIGITYRPTSETCPAGRCIQIQN